MAPTKQFVGVWMMLGALVLGVSAQTGCTKYSLPAGWTFQPNVDSPGGDVMFSGISSGDWAALIAACDTTPGCKALNTWGWFKYTVASSLSSSPSTDPCRGLLIRQGDPPIPARCLKYNMPPSGWEFKQGMDSNGYDVMNVPNLGGDWAKIIAACDATPGCKYANTGGWMKYMLSTLRGPNTPDPCVGLFVRLGDPPIPLRCVKFSLPASGGWEFRQGVDMPGADVTYYPSLGGDWAKLISSCDATPGCKCINTGGWAKYKNASWSSMNNPDPCVGTLLRMGDPPIPLRCVKYSLPPSGWIFKQGVDSSGTDCGYTSGVNGDWAKAIAACDSYPGCMAVNTGGWSKCKISSYRNTGTDEPCSGLLERGNYTAPPAPSPSPSPAPPSPSPIPPSPSPSPAPAAEPPMAGALEPPLPSVEYKAKVPVGINLPRLDQATPHYGGAWAAAGTTIFTDLFKLATPFVCQARSSSGGGSGTWGWGDGKCPLRPDGYPSAILQPESWRQYGAASKVGSPGAAYYAAGKYVLLYDGQGKIILDGDATVNWQAPGRIGLTLAPANGFAVRILETDTSNPVRNISVVPAAKELTFATDIYQPDFLKLLNGLKVLRFSNWQRVWGDERNPQVVPRSWDDRSTLATHSYLRKDGVSIEHMVALANKINATPFFSLPLAANASDAYAAGMATAVAKQLDAGLQVYIEAGQGGPGWMTTDFATRLLMLARIWRKSFTDAGADPKRVVVVATYLGASAIPYFFDTFKPSEQAEVDAIAVAGAYGPRSWNSNKPCFYNFNYMAWLRKNPNITYEAALNLTRSSVIHADITHTRWAGRLKAAGKKLMALQGGADMYLQAPYYSMRMNYHGIASCSSYPCTKSPLYQMDSGSLTFNTEAERNATLDSVLPWAAAEYNLDEQLMQIKLREPATTDHMLDFLHRWQLAGGDAMFVELPASTCCTCGPGTKTLVPKECQAGSSITNQASPSSSPIFKAVQAFIAGANGSLPLTSAWDVKPTPCEPACQSGTCVKGACVCYAGWSGAACDTPTPRPNECNSLIGVGVEGIADWAHSWTFVDIMKHGRAWISQAFDGSGGWGNTSGVARGEGDWVSSLETNQKAGSILMRDLQGHMPAGTYTLMWDGDGIVDVGAFDVQETRHIAAGLAQLDVKPSTDFNNGLFVTVERTNPQNPVRNIRVLMPGFEAATAEALPFHPRFVSSLKKYGVLRFMNWMKSNLKGPATWEERAKPTDRSFAGHNPGGFPIEWMVKLANHVGAAPWFNINHLSDDDYTRRFAQQVKETLRPDVKVYVEWSNEAWHTGFEGGKFAQAEGLRLNMIEQGDKWYGGSTNEARLCYIAERTKNMSRIWKEVFADDPSRVVVVIAGQASWPVAAEKVFTCRNVTSFVDAFAIAPYFGSWTSADTDLESFVANKLPAQIDKALKTYVAPHVAIAKKYNKPLITYEAGQSLTGDNELPMKANRHPGMKAAYTKYLDGLLAAGLSHINHYTAISAYSKHGSWGLLEWQDQDPSTAPKLMAVQEFIAAHSQCSANSSTGNNTFSSNPDAGGSCEAGCSDHGECVDGSCACFTGYSGPACNITSYTDKYDCGYKCTFDQGTCSVKSTQGATKYWGCTCEDGFYGNTCSLFKCPNDCSFSGTCLDKGVCACFPGYKGAACEVDCGCNGHGMCTDSGSCLCDAGYRLGANGCEPDCVCEDASVGCIAPGECGCKECKYGACFNGRCECWAGYTGPGCTELKPSARANLGSPVGVEVSGPAYWSTQWTWINAMAQSSPGWWTQRAADRGDLTNVSTAFDSGTPLDLTPDGYPRSLPDGVIAHKLVLRNVQLHAMAGRYVALWDGDGVVDVLFDAKVASVGKRRLEFDFNPTANAECWARGEAYCGDNGMWVVLRATNPSNPVRNLRILPKALENVADRQPFHPWVLKDLERYSVLRFMSWLGTNTDTATVPRAWQQRVMPTADTQTGPGGVAWEYVVKLCNQLGASPWINVHHLADDDYVRSLALFLKYQLRPDVKVYVEHSNEVWNTGFAQGKYARAKGVELGLAGADRPDIAGYRYHAKRSAEIFDIFTDVFGPDVRQARLKYIVSSWAFICNNGVGCGATAVNTTLSYADVSQKADALALTAYFGCGLGSNGAADALLSVDDMLAKCNTGTDLQQARSTLTTLKSYAASFGLPLATYEAGPSIMEASVIFNGGGSQAAALKYIALQRDPRFEAVYSKYLQLYDELGLVNETFPFMQFTSAGYPSKYGSWGLIEYTGQDRSTAPKARALHALLDAKQPPSIRPGCWDPDMGAAGLADGQYSGVPAMLSPGKGAVWVQGVDYNLTFPAMRTPVGSITVSIFQGTDCTQQPPLATLGPLAVQAANSFETFATLRVPSDLLGSGYLLRVQGTVNGAAATIYSEYVAVQQLKVNGQCNPSLPYLPPPPRCSPELAWNVSNLPTGLCKIEANGCRSYRTARDWYSSGKPATDCTAQYSPRPSRAALTAAGLPVGGDC